MDGLAGRLFLVALCIRFADPNIDRVYIAHVLFTEMEQIFMIEVFVEKLILKIEPPLKTPSELQLEQERRLAAEAAEAAVAAGKKGKGKGKGGKKGKQKKGKKGKGKEPPGPSAEELRFMQTCTVQMRCLPVFDFYIAHDNFVAPPPPPPPDTGKKKKGKKSANTKKGKKGKKGKGGPEPRKIELPSEPVPDMPLFCVGNVIMFISRPSKLEEIMKFTPISVNVWNRDDNLNCIGFVIIEWDDAFFNAIRRAEELNPLQLDGEFRNTTRTEMVSVTVEMHKPLQCEEDLKLSGEIAFYVRLTALGNKVMSNYVTLPEMPMVPARTYLTDEYQSKDIEAVRNWEGSTIGDFTPIAYLFGAPDITRAPILPREEHRVFEEYVAPFTDDELLILAMGFPKGPCGGTNCPKRMESRGSDHQFIYGKYIKGKFKHGNFVNKRNVHGPCGRLDCPMAAKVRDYLQREGAFKPCTRPCNTDYY